MNPEKPHHPRTRAEKADAIADLEKQLEAVYSTVEYGSWGNRDIIDADNEASRLQKEHERKENELAKADKIAVLKGQIAALSEAAEQGDWHQDQAVLASKVAALEAKIAEIKRQEPAEEVPTGTTHEVAPSPTETSPTEQEAEPPATPQSPEKPKDDSESPVDRPKEEVSPDHRAIHERFKQFGVTEETLADIEGFATLSTEQKALTLNLLGQEIMRETETESVATVKDNQKKNRTGRYKNWLHLKPFVMGLVNSITKQPSIVKHQKEIVERIASGTADQSDRLTNLTKLVASGPAVRIETAEDGSESFTFDFLSEHDFGRQLEQAEKQEMLEFNQAAREYQAVPTDFRHGKTDQHGNPRYSAEQIAEFEAKERAYLQARNEILALEPNGQHTQNEQVTRLGLINTVDARLYNSRLLTTNPEIEQTLSNIKDRAVWQQAIGRVMGVKGLAGSNPMMFAGGMGARAAIGSALAGLGAPVTALAGGAAVGGARGYLTARENLKENELLAKAGRKWEGDSYRDRQQAIKELQQQLEALPGDAPERTKLTRRLAKLQAQQEKAHNKGEIGETRNITDATKLSEKLETKVGQLDTSELATAFSERYQELQAAIDAKDEAAVARLQGELRTLAAPIMSIDARVGFTTRKMEEDLINFGTSQERLGNQLTLMQRLETARLAIHEFEQTVGTSMQVIKRQLGEPNNETYRTLKANVSATRQELFNARRNEQQGEDATKVDNLRALIKEYQEKMKLERAKAVIEADSHLPEHRRGRQQSELEARLNHFLNTIEGTIDARQKKHLYQKMRQGMLFGGGFALAGSMVHELKDYLPELSSSASADEAGAYATASDEPITEAQFREILDQYFKDCCCRDNAVGVETPANSPTAPDLTPTAEPMAEIRTFAQDPVFRHILTEKVASLPHNVSQEQFLAAVIDRLVLILAEQGEISGDLTPETFIQAVDEVCEELKPNSPEELPPPPNPDTKEPIKTAPSSFEGNNLMGQKPLYTTSEPAPVTPPEPEATVGQTITDGERAEMEMFTNPNEVPSVGRSGEEMEMKPFIKSTPPAGDTPTPEQGAQVANMDSKLAAIDRQLDTLQADITKLADADHTLDEISEQIAALREMDAVLEQAREATAGIAGADEQLDALEQKLAELKRLDQQLATIDAQVRDAQLERAIKEEDLANAVAAENLEAELASKLLTELNETPDYRINPGDRLEQIVEQKIEAHDTFKAMDAGAQSEIKNLLRTRLYNMSQDELKEFGLRAVDGTYDIDKIWPNDQIDFRALINEETAAKIEAIATKHGLATSESAPAATGGGELDINRVVKDGDTFSDYINEYVRSSPEVVDLKAEFGHDTVLNALVWDAINAEEAKIQGFGIESGDANLIQPNEHIRVNYDPAQVREVVERFIAERNNTVPPSPEPALSTSVPEVYAPEPILENGTLSLESFERVLRDSPGTADYLNAAAEHSSLSPDEFQTAVAKELHEPFATQDPNSLPRNLYISEADFTNAIATVEAAHPLTPDTPTPPTSETVTSAPEPATGKPAPTEAVPTQTTQTEPASTGDQNTVPELPTKAQAELLAELNEGIIAPERSQFTAARIMSEQDLSNLFKSSAWEQSAAWKEIKSARLDELFEDREYGFFENRPNTMEPPYGLDDKNLTDRLRAYATTLHKVGGGVPVRLGETVPQYLNRAAGYALARLEHVSSLDPDPGESLQEFLGRVGDYLRAQRATK